MSQRRAIMDVNELKASGEKDLNERQVALVEKHWGDFTRKKLENLIKTRKLAIDRSMTKSKIIDALIDKRVFLPVPASSKRSRDKDNLDNRTQARSLQERRTKRRETRLQATLNLTKKSTLTTTKTQTQVPPSKKR